MWRGPLEYLSIALGTSKDLVSSQGHLVLCPQFPVGHRNFSEPSSAEELRHPQESKLGVGEAVLPHSPSLHPLWIGTLV